MNGSPWTRAEIDELVRVVTQGGNTLALSLRLNRTHDALIAKAKRLQVCFILPRADPVPVVVVPVPTLEHSPPPTLIDA